MKKEESKNDVAKAKEREPGEERTITSVSTELSCDPGLGMRFDSEVALGAPLPFLQRNPTAVDREMKSH